jgi:hypothetical protein
MDTIGRKLSAEEALELVERELRRPEIVGTQRHGLDRAAEYLRRAITNERGHAAWENGDTVS